MLIYSTCWPLQRDVTECCSNGPEQWAIQNTLLVFSGVVILHVVKLPVLLYMYLVLVCLPGAGISLLLHMSDKCDMSLPCYLFVLVCFTAHQHSRGHIVTQIHLKMYI